MKRPMILLGTFLALILWGIPPAAGEPKQSPRPDYVEAFDSLKSLVGTWEGKGRRGDVKVVYHLTGNGSTLVESFFGADKPVTGPSSMSTLYHMDGEDLRATHYCGAKNQPRFRAVSHDPESRTLRFEFIDVTNLSRPGAYFTREIEIILRDGEHMHLAFNGLRDGEPRPVAYELTRQRESGQREDGR